MLTVVFILLILVSLAAIAWIIVPKIPYIASAQVEDSPREKLLRLKKQIVRGRIARRIGEIEKKIVTPESRQRIKTATKSAYAKLRAIEDRYRAQTAETKVKLLIKRGAEHQDDDPEFAEKCFLDAIAHDKKNIEAYEGLAKIYTVRNNSNEANEVLHFLLKLNPARSGRYLFALAGVYAKSGDAAQAGDYARQALEDEPDNPKYLDFLTNIAILDKDKKTAKKYLDRLKKGNAENVKIEEFEKRLRLG